MDREHEEYIDVFVLLIDFWHGLRKFWFLIPLLMILGGVGYTGYQKIQYDPMYRAQASFTVKTLGQVGKNEISTSYSFYYDKNTASQIGSTFPYILRSEVFQKRLKERLETNIINGSVGASVIENSNVVTLQVISPNPEDAKNILHGVLELYPEISKYVIGNIQLEILNEPEVGVQPYNRPNYKKSLVIGAAIGFCGAMAIVLLYALSKKTIRSEEDLKNIVNVSCMAQIPEMKKKYQGMAVDGEEKHNGFRESIYSLQNRVEYQMAQNGAKVLMVTSTSPSEGKSTISLNLAKAMAKRGKKVILVDGDFRKTDLVKRLDVQCKHTLYDVAYGHGAQAEDVLLPLESGVLFFGSQKPEKNVIKAIDSKAMRRMIERFRESADVVIIDTPPCGMLADAAYYYQYADAVLYVVRQDWTDMNKMRNAVAELPEQGAKMIGCVMNQVKTGPMSYGGNYGYGRYSYKRYHRYKGNYYGE